MRKLYFLLFTFFSLSANAQTYTPLPDSGGVWVNHFVQYYLDQNFFPVYYNHQYTNYCTSGEDTLINATLYTIVGDCNGGYEGAIRDDGNGNTFFVPVDSTSEYLIYAFDVNPGDTLYNIYQRYFNGNQVEIVDLVVGNHDPDTVLINGEYRKQVFVGDALWIEGIGSTTGLFMDNGLNVSNFFIDLNCHSHLDTVLFGSGLGPGSCALDLSVGDDEEILFSVKPNPFNNQLILSLGGINEEVEIYIYDLSGKVHFQTSCGSGEHLIDLENLRSGTYILKIQDERSFRTQKIIKL